jgi:DNA primase
MISPETIALVKERTDLVALIAETVKLKRLGRRFIGLCPFHQEKTPSFNVNAENGFFHCFGCKESGGAVDFVMKIEGYSFPEAIRMLAERAGIEVAETLTDQERREAGAARNAKEELYRANDSAASFFERSLRGASAHPLARYAREELIRRGLPLPEENDGVGEAARIGDTLQAFRIGYAPFGWDALANYLRQQGISPVVAERVGLLVPRTSGSGHYDRFRHRLMFAVSDVQGRVIAFSGRALPDPSPDDLTAHKISGPSAQPDAAPAKYINSPESPIYTKGDHLFGLHQARQAIRQSGQALLVEGNFDVVALHGRGVGTAVAPLGTAFTPAQAKLLKRFAPSVVVLFDGDNAGRKATRAARGPCREGGLSAKVAMLPKGADPDDYARKHGAEGIERLVKSAIGMLEYVIEDALEGDAFRGASLEEQRARLRAVTNLLGEENDPTVRAMAKTYADQLSSKLVVRGQAPASLRELESAVEQAVSSGSSQRQQLRPSEVGVTHDRARSRARHEDLAPQMVGALLDFPELIEDPEVEQALGTLDGDPALAVAALRRTITEHARHAINGPQAGDAGPEASARRSIEIGVYADEFLAQIPRSIHPFAVGRLASPEHDTLEAARNVLLDNARKLSSLSLKRENAAEVEQLHRVEAQGDAAKENEALLRAVERAQKRHGLT